MDLLRAQVGPGAPFLCQSDLGADNQKLSSHTGQDLQAGRIDRVQVQTTGHRLGQHRWRPLELRTERSEVPTKTITWAANQRDNEGRLGFQ